MAAISIETRVHDVIGMPVEFLQRLAGGCVVNLCGFISPGE
jgi:hypothetical protein